MRSGLGDFIKQSHAPNTVGRKELDRRSNLDNHKVSRESIYGVAPRWVPQKPQPSNGNVKVEDDLFAGSVLDESDDTARDIDVGANGRDQRIQQIGDRPAEDIGAVDEEPDGGHDSGRQNKGSNHYFGNDHTYDGNQNHERQLERGFLPPGNAQADVVVQQFQNIKNDPAYSAAIKIYEARNVDTRTPFIGRFQAIPQSHLKQPPRGGGRNHLELNGAAPLGDEQHPHEEYNRHQLDLRVNTRGRDQLIAEMDHDGIDDEDTGSEIEESTIHSSPSQPTPQAIERWREQGLGNKKLRHKRHSPVELDYEEAALSHMKYSELKDQPFDTNPTAPPSVVPENLQSPKASLDVRLQHFAGQSSDLQHKLFTEMRMDQWEESGDWFLDRFSNIMSRLKDARKAKRDLSKAFEEELAVREETVRGKDENIQEVMRQMRAGGEGVLRGRSP